MTSITDVKGVIGLPSTRTYTPVSAAPVLPLTSVTIPIGAIMARRKQLNIFLSSTSEDLQDYRAVARLAVLDMGWMPKMMEHMGATPLPTVYACQELLADCDLVILIAAFRRGWVPTSEQGGNNRDSITALELTFAREHHIPVIAMLANETWPGNLWEDDTSARDWIKTFRKDLNLPAEFFSHEPLTGKESERLPIFRSKIRSALVSYQERRLAEETPEEETTEQGDYFESAIDELINGGNIPFVGPGIFGDGPLSTRALADALGEGAAGTQACLATAAEYKERHLGYRKRFLNQFKHVLQDQTARVSSSSVYDLISNLHPLPLIISATYDCILEKKFDAAGRSYATVCHIVRSLNGEYDGRILVVRKDAKPEIAFADKVSLSDVECVLYKPLGSPFLHDLLDEQLGLDTVVVTETDHLTFLGRLENQHTQVPTAFSRILQLRPLLFIGYSLDVWQYRLVMQVFQSAGLQSANAAGISVREPGSPMEQLAWRRLGIDLIRMDPCVFARRVLSDARVAEAQTSHAV